MGLFELFRTKDTQFFLDKSEKAIASQDFGEALAFIRKAIQHAEKNNDGDGLEKAKSKESDLKRKIYGIAVEQAGQYLRSGQKDAAQNAIERASRYVQSDAERDALNNLVESADHWQEEEVAEAHVDGEERVSTLDDDDKWNLYVTSLTFEKAEHCDRLGKDFKKALLALQDEAYDEALEMLEKVYRESPANEGDVYIMCQLGQAYMGKRDFRKADEILEKADRTEDDIETKLLRTQILWALKKFDVAEGVLQSAHDMDPDNAQVLAMIAQHGLVARDYESGIAAIEVLIEKLPNDISVQRLAGRLYQESGDDEKALECFETVNRIFWQVDPRTHKLTFDQDAAAAAAGIYFRRGEKLDRCVELYEAIRANTEGETHVGVCLQLAGVYEKMGRKAKRMEMFDESMRFLDGMIDKARGAERAMMQLQYAEIAEKAGDGDKTDEMIQTARAFFADDAEKGQPVAAFYVDLIDKKLAGEPLPAADEMQERLIEFAKARGLVPRDPAQAREMARRAAEQGVASVMPDDPEEVQPGGVEPENVGITMSGGDSEAASDFLRAMIQKAGVDVSSSPVLSVAGDEGDESGAGEEEAMSELTHVPAGGSSDMSAAATEFEDLSLAFSGDISLDLGTSGDDSGEKKD